VPNIMAIRQEISMHKRRPNWPVLLLILLVFTAAARAQSTEPELLDGLRQRGLFELARVHCQSQLKLSQQPRQQVEWTVEWMRTLAAEAQQAGAAEQEQLWKSAADIAADFIAQQPRNPRSLLVAVHAALLQLSRGQLQRLEAEIASDSEAATELARQQLRLAIRQLQQLDGEMLQLIRQAPQQSQGDEFSSAELLSLQNNLRFQLGRAYRQQALSYPDDSQDRIAALGRATEQLEKPLTQLAEDDPLTAQVLLELAAVARLRKQSAQAALLLERLDKIQPAVRLVLAARAEKIQLALANGQTASAIELLQLPRRLSGEISPNLDMALLDTYLTLARDADKQMDSRRLDQLEKQSLQLVTRIRQDHGGYWGRRAEIRLVRQAGQLPGARNLGIMEKTADDLYLRGKFPEAIAAYQQAGSQADQLENMELAFTLYYKAALVSEKQEDLPAVIEQLRMLSGQLEEHPRSPLAHLKGVQYAYQLGQQDDAWLAIYQQMLTEHLQRWPSDPSSDQVRVWIAARARAEKNWLAAIATYEAVSREYPRMPVVLEVLEACWLNHLVTIEPGERVAGLQRAASYFQSHFQDQSGRIVEQWSPAARQAVLAIARLQLQLQVASYPQLEQLLRAASEGQPLPAKEWTNQASAILMVALAGQGKLAEADQLIKQVADQSAPQLFQLMASLAELARKEGAGNSQLAQLQLAMFERSAAQRESLTAPQQVSWDLAHGRALAVGGKQQQAQLVLAQLAEDHPKSAQVQQTYAQVLTAASDKAAWPQAQLQWRRVLSRARPQGSLWYEATYGIALCYFKLGQKQEAAARIEYLQATSGLPAGPLKQQFLDLLRKCQ